VRGVLLDALLGIGHLHYNEVLHGDIKPDNILVDDRERGRLADFDISIDTQNRTSAAHVMKNMINTTVCATALGMTTNFAAPELQASGQASKHTDVFAFGKTVEFVNFNGHCDPKADDPHEAHDQTNPFVQSLISELPSTRPSAKEATNFPFFTILAEARKKVTKTCLLCELNGDDSVKVSVNGIECSEGHFHCGECVAKLTQDLLKYENGGKRVRQEAQVMCAFYPRECRASNFYDQDLARHLSAEDFKSYLNSRLEIIESKLKMELESEMKKKLEEEKKRLASSVEYHNKVVIARKHIEEEILQMKCPRAGCRYDTF